MPSGWKSHAQAPGNKLEREKYPELQGWRTSLFLLPTLGQIKFCFVVQEFRSVEGLGAVEKEDGINAFHLLKGRSKLCSAYLFLLCP